MQHLRSHCDCDFTGYCRSLVASNRFTSCLAEGVLQNILWQPPAAPWMLTVHAFLHCIIPASSLLPTIMWPSSQTDSILRMRAVRIPRLLWLFFIDKYIRKMSIFSRSIGLSSFMPLSSLLPGLAPLLS